MNYLFFQGKHERLFCSFYYFFYRTGKKKQNKKKENANKKQNIYSTKFAAMEKKF